MQSAVLHFLTLGSRVPYPGALFRGSGGTPRRERMSTPEAASRSAKYRPCVKWGAFHPNRRYLGSPGSRLEASTMSSQNACTSAFAKRAAKAILFVSAVALLAGCVET